MKALITFLFMGMLLSTSLLTAQNNYKILYEADKDGKRISGDLDSLVKYVQNGNPVRVGWALRMKPPKEDKIIEMQHWTDAGFVTTLRGHVFAQIRGIFQQGPGLDSIPSVHIASENPDTWVAIIGTTGMMRQQFKMDDEMLTAMKGMMTDEEFKKQMREMKAQKVRTKWAVMR